MHVVPLYVEKTLVLHSLGDVFSDFDKQIIELMCRLAISSTLILKK